jgi:hypothetical protein
MRIVGIASDRKARKATFVERTFVMLRVMCLRSHRPRNWRSHVVRKTGPEDQTRAPANCCLSFVGTKSEQIRVLIADDNERVRRGIACLLGLDGADAAKCQGRGGCSFCASGDRIHPRDKPFHPTPEMRIYVQCWIASYQGLKL